MKSTPENLKAELEAYKELFNTCESPTIIVDEHGNFLDYNLAYTTLFGYTKKEELQNYNPINISPEYQPDGKKSVDKGREVIKKALEEGLYEFEWLHQKANKETFLSLVSAQKIIFKNLKALKVVIKDISKEKELQRQVDIKTQDIKKQKELLRSVIDQHPSPIVVKNYDAKFILVNETVAKLYGTNVEDMIGKDDGDYIPDQEQAEFFRQNVREIMDKGEPEVVYEDSYDVKTKQTRHYMSIKKPFLNSAGEKNILVIANDITELTHANKVLKDKDRLLFQQSKMAAMGEMIGNIAHQWRQPLSMISTLATGIKFEKELDIITEEEEMKSLERINEIVQHLSTTIDDFRDFFKPDKTKNEFSLIELFAKVYSLISAQFNNSNIQIIKDIENINIYAFENQLIQVILNILNNSKDAFKNSNFEEKYIFIRIYQDEEYTFIEIKDSAGGIKDDIIERVFEPYFTTKHESQGTGIGLYMSEEMVVKNMQGSIVVVNDEYEYKSSSYKGAMFTIKIPN